jgi:hypothetical protein
MTWQGKLHFSAPVQLGPGGRKFTRGLVAERRDGRSPHAADLTERWGEKGVLLCKPGYKWTVHLSVVALVPVLPGQPTSDTGSQFEAWICHSVALSAPFWRKVL